MSNRQAKRQAKRQAWKHAVKKANATADETQKGQEKAALAPKARTAEHSRAGEVIQVPPKKRSASQRWKTATAARGSRNATASSAAPLQGTIAIHSHPATHQNVGICPLDAIW
jgi:hypothetical protein